MKARLQLAVLVALVVAGAIAIAACGGSSSSGATTGGSTSAAEPSKEFAGKGPNGELANAGKESSAAEREAASKVLEQNLQARTAGDWASQCATLAEPVLEQLEKSASKGEKKQSCPADLETLAAKAPQSSRANTMTEPLAALRVNGDLAFAFYHGAGGKDYVVPMEKEAGEWKVAALSVQEAP